ncbi:MAG: molybdopterin-dependent oxidoreductase [Deltaproteobacteria bacterium]|nr:MAG: molybdopterin-dependent oxidoreductase [Deltaproteobacteria bacterium]
MAEQVTRSICRFCNSRCGLLVTSEDGQLVRIEEDRKDPRVDMIFPPTKACVRLPAAKEYVYHPERVRFPLKRKGEKGENKWETISWPQALDEIAAKLGELVHKYGPESLAATGGTGRTILWPYKRFMNLLGSPNIVAQAMICFAPAHAPAAAMIGWPLRHRGHVRVQTGADGRPVTKCVLILGMDPSQARLRFWKSLRETKKRGGTKIIVVDPRRTQTAELADLWLQIRPGTDTALLLSMINVVIQEALYDAEFVNNWCYGFDPLKERVKDYTPEKAAEITWVPAEKIREAARIYATERPGISVHGMGTEHLENSQDAIQARIILAALVNNIDVYGGDGICGPSPCISEVEMELGRLLSPEQRSKQIGADRFKLLSWPGRELIWEQNRKYWGSECLTYALSHGPSLMRAILTGQPYSVRAVITQNSNPLVTFPNIKLVYKALKSLDLYVVKDFWLTPSAQLADYVLPTACWLERPELIGGQGLDNRIIGGEAALPAKVPGLHEHWTDYEFFRELGLRMGQSEEYWPWQTLEEAFDYQLAPLGLTFKQFMVQENGVHTIAKDEYEKHTKRGGFGTPTGKLELSSTILEKLGYDPLPRYVEPHEDPLSSPDLCKEYPLMLITGGRFIPYFHSEHRQIPSIRKRYPDPKVQIHPDTANELGIQDGDWVWIEGLRGRVRQRAELFDGIYPQVVHAQHGWWFPERPGEEPWLAGVWESNIDVLTDDDPDHCNTRSGGWPLKTALCKVYKCKEVF